MLFATVVRGKKLATRLVPHRFEDNRYHVHLGRKGPYIPIADDRDAVAFGMAGEFVAQLEAEGRRSRAAGVACHEEVELALSGIRVAH